jgi:hypothetical protein
MSEISLILVLQNKNNLRGARQFIEQFQTGLFVPMHFVASGFKSAWRMKEFTDAVQIPFWKIAHEGESIDI